MLTIPTTDKDCAIIRNINDTLLWYRVSDGIWKIINAARSGEEHDFDGDNYYHGLSLSFHLLGISYDDKLCGELDEIFWRHKEASDNKTKDGQDQTCWSSAVDIYADWVAFLKEYTLSNLKPVA